MAQGFDERLVRDFERGELRDGDFRYMLIRADTLMGIFRTLPQAERAAALDAFKAAVVEYGSRSARSYQAKLASEDRRRLFDVIAATAPQLGWGRWRFIDAGDGLTVEVDNSPFAAGHGPSDTPVCHAIAGMLTASGTLALGGPVSAVETRCAAQAGAGPCRFEVARVP